MVLNSASVLVFIWSHMSSAIMQGNSWWNLSGLVPIHHHPTSKSFLCSTKAQKRADNLKHYRGQKAKITTRYRLAVGPWPIAKHIAGTTSRGNRFSTTASCHHVWIWALWRDIFPFFSPKGITEVRILQWNLPIFKYWQLIPSFGSKNTLWSNKTHPWMASRPQASLSHVQPGLQPLA